MRLLGIVVAAVAAVVAAIPATAQSLDCVRVVNDRAPDCSSLAAIVQSVTKDCKTDDDRAIAIYNFCRYDHYHQAAAVLPTPLEPAKMKALECGAAAKAERLRTTGDWPWMSVRRAGRWRARRAPRRRGWLRICAGLNLPNRVFLRLGMFPVREEITVSGATTLLDSRIMAEVVEAQEGDFELDVARAIVRLHFSDAQNEQMRELADKNNRGELTEEERDKLESYRRVGNFLALLQSKARLSLKHAGLWQR